MPQSYKELTKEEIEIVINNYALRDITEDEADILRRHYIGTLGALKKIPEKYYINFWFEIPMEKSKSKIWFAKYLINNKFVKLIKDV